MFNEMMVKMIQPEKVNWNSPNYLELKMSNEDKFETYAIEKGAENYIYKQLKFKESASKEVYKKAEPIWNQLKEYLLQQNQDNHNLENQFNLEDPNLIYLVDEYKNIVDIRKINSKEALNEFKDSLDKFIIDITTTTQTKKFYTDGKGGLIKLICYDTNANLPEEEYTPIVLIEFNNDKSIYKVYTGILIYKTFSFIPSISCYLNCDHLSDFINQLDIPEILKFSKENASSLYEAYLTFSRTTTEISARELITILKKVGYKLQLKADDQLDTISNLSDEESNTKIQKFFNTFTFITGESALDILSLSELQKIFRYNKLTMLEVLSILSKEYLTYEGAKITCDILGTLVYNLYDKNNDKKQCEKLKKEIQ